MAKRGNNEGSIYKREEDGLWRGAISIKGGKRKYVSGRTRQEVAKKLTVVLKANQDSVPVPSDLLTVASYAKDWLLSVKLSIRHKTYESYESTLRVHVIPHLGHIRLSKLTPGDLERMYAMLTEKGAAPKSVRIYHGVIHSMLEKAVKQNVLVRNVASLADLPRKVRRDLPMITPQQAQAFLHATREHRLEGLFVLAITSAARQGELLGLTWDCVDLDAGLIDVRKALQKVEGKRVLVEPKTPSSVRTIALTELAKAALGRHRERQIRERMYVGAAWLNELNLVFTTPVGTPLDKDNVRKRELPQLYKAAGLPPELTFHDLRHIAASLALGSGVSIPTVSEMLGHTDPSTTLRVYAHAIPGAQREAARALDKVLGQ